jgi:ferredoxin
MKRLEVDQERCTGHGRCYDLAPELFEPDDFGHGQVTPSVPPEQIDESKARAAVLACPEGAVHFES